MAENPDRKEETTGLLPFLGALRYVDHGMFKSLQQYQYSASDGKNDWYDVPTFSASALEEIPPPAPPKDYPENSVAAESNVP